MNTDLNRRQRNPIRFLRTTGRWSKKVLFEHDNLHIQNFGMESIMRLVVARYVLLTSFVRGSAPSIITRLTRMSDRPCNHDDRQRCRTEQEDRADAEPYREAA